MKNLLCVLLGAFLGLSGTAIAALPHTDEIVEALAASFEAGREAEAHRWAEGCAIGDLRISRFNP